jgi:hypothetical protein
LERGLLRRRIVDGAGVIYHASEEFKAGALMHAALGPQIDPGSEN